MGNYHVNPQDIYQKVTAPYNSEMDIYETRRINLQTLIDERFGGTQRKFAEAIDRQPDYISRCLRGHKRIGEAFARHIEQSLGGPPVNLDKMPHIFAAVDSEIAKGERRERLDDHLTDEQVAERAKYNEMFGDKPLPSRSQDGTEKSVVSPSDRKNELEFVGRLDAWDSNTPLDDDEVELPLFREVELAAGAGQTEVIENRGAKLRFAKSTLSRAGVMKENAACAFVRGNSMDPVMPNGTCVGVNTGDTTVRDGEIYAIDHDGMLRVKYLHRRPGGGIKIVSQNANEHEPEDYSAQRVSEQNIRIIGRVFWWSVLR